MGNTTPHEIWKDNSSKLPGNESGRLKSTKGSIGSVWPRSTIWKCVLEITTNFLQKRKKIHFRKCIIALSADIPFLEYGAHSTANSVHCYKK